MLAVTHTCQHWRVTAIAAADLWSQLIAGDSRKNFDDMTRFVISVLGELPMDADLGYRLEVVALHANRLHTLSCRGCTIDNFSYLSNHPVPLFETLHILPHDHFDSECSPLPTPFNRDRVIPRPSGSSLSTATIPFPTTILKTPHPSTCNYYPER